MGILISLLGLALPVAIIGLVVIAVRRASGREGGGVDEQGVRRFFQYALLYGLLIVAAVGLSGLLGRIFEGQVLVDADEPGLAWALTATIIGVPLYALLAVWSRRRLAGDPEEARSFGWSLYTIAAPLTALGVAMTDLYEIASFALGVKDFDPRSAAALLVWGVVWAGHWFLLPRPAGEAAPQLHLVLGAAAGLAVSATGLALLVGAALGTFLDIGGGVTLVDSRSGIAWAGAITLTGVPVWAIYWLATLSKAPRTPLWHIYVLPIGVGGGLATAVVAGSVLAFDVLVWFLGDPGAADASRWFRSAPTLVGALAVGLLTWWYHRSALGGTEQKMEPRRVYEYLMAASGLAAAAVGISIVIVALIEAVSPSPVVETGASAVNTLLAAVTMVTVGAPLWWVFWRRVDRAAQADPEAELVSPTRRIYLFILIGVGAVVAVVTVLVGVYLLIEDLLQARFGGETLRRARWAIGPLLAAVAIAWYHWSVFRRDRDLVPRRPEGPALRQVVLVGPADDDIARDLGRATGARVELWPRADGAGAPWSLEELTAALDGVGTGKAVVVSTAAGLEVATITE